MNSKSDQSRRKGVRLVGGKKRKIKSVGLKIGNLTVAGKAKERVDMMERRKVDVLCSGDQVKSK